MVNLWLTLKLKVFPSLGVWTVAVYSLTLLMVVAVGGPTVSDPAAPFVITMSAEYVLSPVSKYNLSPCLAPILNPWFIPGGFTSKELYFFR